MSKAHKHSKNKFPISYSENTRQEREILQLADNFYRQFKYLYPDRKKPPLYLENECKVKKLVSSTLCSLKVAMPTELRKWQSCANFFADFFDYEVLCPPVECPAVLPSIETILKKRKGNSLEISTVLCTFLLASGYDTYVVQGYARRNICEKLENREMLPPIEFDTDSENHKRFFTKKEQENITYNKYELDFEVFKSFWLEGKSTFQPKEDTKDEPEIKEFEEDVYFGKRLHFWILMSSYENGSVETFFVEPTTGEKKSTDDLNYLGIEFVWNNKNFWCNKRRNDGSCKEIKFDLDNYFLWEAFLPDFSINDNSVCMPPTWVKSVVITQEDYRNRLPKEGRKFHYKTATVVKYNSGASGDGLVYHITYYKTEDKEHPVESHAFFSKRKDFLEYRKTDLANRLVVDVFAQGREDSLKEHEYPLEGIFSFPQKLQFYAHLRNDKLSCRTWNDEITVDTYVDRSDRLVVRKVYYLEKECERDIQEILSDVKLTEKSSESKVISPIEAKKSESKNESIQLEAKKSVSSNAKDDTNTSEELIGNSERKQSISFETEIGEVEEKRDETVLVGISPQSFDPENILFEDVDFNTWKFEYFLDSIDPAEKYATSESESEEEKVEDGTEKPPDEDEDSSEEVKAEKEQNGVDQEFRSASEGQIFQYDNEFGEVETIKPHYPELGVKHKEQLKEERDDIAVEEKLKNEIINVEIPNEENIDEEESKDENTDEQKTKEMVHRTEDTNGEITIEEKSEDVSDKKGLEEIVDTVKPNDEALGKENFDEKVIVGEKPEGEVIDEEKLEGMIIHENTLKQDVIKDPNLDREVTHIETTNEKNIDEVPEGENNDEQKTKEIVHRAEKTNEEITIEEKSEDFNENKGLEEMVDAVKADDEAFSKENDEKEIDRAKPEEEVIDEEKLDDVIIHENKSKQDVKKDPKLDEEDTHKGTTNDQKYKDRSENEEPILKEDTEGEFDKEMEIYDEINFDALSDEEIEVDYQLFLSKLWEERLRNDKKDLFYMTREFHTYKDLRNRDILKLKKRIMRKRRKNVRYLQRVELGKPAVRIYKRKTDDILKREKSIYTNDLMNFLNLKDVLRIDNASALKEFHEIDILDKLQTDAVNSEVIKKECLRLLDEKLKSNGDGKRLCNIQCIRNTYLKDPSLPVECSVENIWFDFETGSYRLDFHYPPEGCSRKILLFTKPEAGNTDFKFSDVLCRQILPSYEAKHFKKSQLYSYLVTLLKKEPLLMREYERFEREMKDILENRFKEESLTLKKRKMVAKETAKTKETKSPPRMVYTEQTDEKDMISLTMETLKLSMPLSENEGKKVYKTIFDEFYKEAVRKVNALEKEYNDATEHFESFLEGCKNWNELNEERERSLTDACGEFYGIISSIKHRCDAQREATKANYVYIKEKLFSDQRLQAHK